MTFPATYAEVQYLYNTCLSDLKVVKSSSELRSALILCSPFLLEEIFTTLQPNEQQNLTSIIAMLEDTYGSQVDLVHTWNELINE